MVLFYYDRHVWMEIIMKTYWSLITASSLTCKLSSLALLAYVYEFQSKISLDLLPKKKRSDSMTAKWLFGLEGWTLWSLKTQFKDKDNINLFILSVKKKSVRSCWWKIALIISALQFGLVISTIVSHDSRQLSCMICNDKCIRLKKPFCLQFSE